MSLAAARAKSPFKDIDSYYKLQIEPELKTWERQRIAAVRRRWLINGVGLAVAAALAAYIWQTPGMNEAWYLLAAAIAAASAVLGLFTTSSLRQEVKTFLTGKLAAFYGFSYEAEPSRNPVDRFRAMDLIPSYDRCRLEDRWSGEAGGVPFDLVEAHLENRKSKGNSAAGWLTIFRGQLMTFASAQVVAGPVVLRRDLGRLANWIRARFTKDESVKFDDPEFEKSFEVFADDPTAAKRLLDPGLRKRLLGLVAGRWLTIAFDKGEVLLAVEGTNLFELGSFGRTLLDAGRVRMMAEELAIIFEVVERLGLKPAARGA